MYKFIIETSNEEMAQKIDWLLDCLKNEEIKVYKDDFLKHDDDFIDNDICLETLNEIKKQTIFLKANTSKEHFKELGM